MSEFKGQTGLKRILNAAGYSLDGLRAAFLGEAAFRQLLLIKGAVPGSKGGFVTVRPAVKVKSKKGAN